MDKEAAIFNEFHSVICKLLKRDEKTIDSCHQQSSVGLKLTIWKSFSGVSSNLQKEGTNVMSLFYQNGIDSLHGIEKRI